MEDQTGFERSEWKKCDRIFVLIIVLGKHDMKRMLIIGAGASVEECIRSGNRPSNPDFDFPVLKNFCNKLFQRNPLPPLIIRGDNVSIEPNPNTHALMIATSAYLTAKDIPFMENSIEAFCEQESLSFKDHNIESLCEHAWNTFGNDSSFWEGFIYQGIYFGLFARFTEQFGLGNVKEMEASKRVASQLAMGDIVLNLNYDLCFDAALQQSKKRFSYSTGKFPYSPRRYPNQITVFKPHGSMNLYVDIKNKKHYFVLPNEILGSPKIKRPEGEYLPYGSILPPRRNKDYKQHYLAEKILQRSRPFSPKVVIFWGVGLPESDIDLLSIYGEATEQAEVIEIINPDSTVHSHAEAVLGKKIDYFSTLSEGFRRYDIPDFLPT